MQKQMYNDPKCYAWTSATWAPPEYKDRKDMVAQLRTQNTHHDGDSVDEKDSAVHDPHHELPHV